MMTIGFIGLGHMGHPMANRLLQAGQEVMVFDMVPKAVASLVQAGATTASLPDLAAAADMIFTSVQTGQQVSDICLGETGLFAHAKPGTIYIDCSSIDVTTTRMLHQAAKAKHLKMLDAPVSGGVAGAQAGTLTFMVGGEENDFHDVEPILKLMGKTIVYAGPAGNGQAAKISNNLLLGISMIGVCEAFILAKKLGLDAKKFFDISSHASGQCWAMTSYCPVPGILPNVPADHDYQPGFMAKMMLKDLHLATSAAENLDAVIPLGAMATALYEQYVQEGFGEKDFSGIINFLEP